MNDNLIKQLRKTLITLLDDENGISSEAYSELQSLAISVQDSAMRVSTGDIFNMVESCEGRYFLPENHGLTE
jgi:uncharacterized membrane protein YvbJ